MLSNMLFLPNKWTRAQVKYEMGTTKWIVEGLDHFSHKTTIFPLGGSTVQVVLI